MRSFHAKYVQWDATLVRDFMTGQAICQSQVQWGRALDSIIHSHLTSYEKCLRVKNGDEITLEKNHSSPHLLNLQYPDTDYGKKEKKTGLSSVDTYI
jgi:hypothetical protein